MAIHLNYGLNSFTKLQLAKYGYPQSYSQPGRMFFNRCEKALDLDLVFLVY